MVGHLSLRRSPRSPWRPSRRGRARACVSAARASLAAVFLGFTQFCVNFNAVYLAERHITSGVVATVFALAAHPGEPAGLGVARPPAEPALRVELAGRGRRHRAAVRPRASEHPADSRQIAAGIGLTLAGMLGASIANVVQARPEVRRFPLFALLAWSMAAGAVIDGADCLRHDRAAGLRPAAGLLARRCSISRCSPRC